MLPSSVEFTQSKKNRCANAKTTVPTNNPIIPCTNTPPIAPKKIITVGVCNPLDKNMGFKKLPNSDTTKIYTVKMMARVELSETENANAIAGITARVTGT